MHGCGNDYIYVDTRKYQVPDPEKTSFIWSNRHKGIGGDGLVLIGSSEIADFSMRIFNADGSEAAMCGNASRCVGKYLFDNNDLEKDEFTLETLSGIKTIKLCIYKDEVESVTVDMGEPAGIKDIDLTEEFSLTGTAVNMGNPHLVFFADDIEMIDLPAIGPKLEHHPLFPERVNVEFAQLLKNNTIRMKVWERGSGITAACGTGACATAVAAAFAGKVKRKSSIIMDGGTLIIEWDEQNNHVFMNGPATTVFEGELRCRM